jgi:GTP cyclohydrolase I
MNFEKVAAGVRMMIEGIDDDVSRDGLIDTPRRVAEIWESFFKGGNLSDEKILGRSFSVENYSSFVIVKNIQFSSFCEHHLLPFFGNVAVAYVPRNNTVIGISKLARLVDKYARSLQLQERLTAQICESVSQNIANDGVLVTIAAQHMCMTARGVMKPGSETVTRAISGLFSTDKSLVIEAQQLIFGKNE